MRSTLERWQPALTGSGSHVHTCRPPKASQTCAGFRWTLDFVKKTAPTLINFVKLFTPSNFYWCYRCFSFVIFSLLRHGFTPQRRLSLIHGDHCPSYKSPLFKPIPDMVTIILKKAEGHPVQIPAAM